jgi:RNA-directed DNA polymerase
MNYQIIIAKDWDDINWFQANSRLAELQYEILTAYRENDQIRVLQTQDKLVKGFAARCLVVRKVTANKGKITFGIDGVVYNTKAQKFEALQSVKALKIILLNQFTEFMFPNLMAACDH